MKRSDVLLLLVLIVLPSSRARYTEDWDSLTTYEAPEWFRDVKLGIFIHWGPYSVPAYRSEWYPRMMYFDEKAWSPRGEPIKMDRGREPTHTYKHHVKTWGPVEKFGYKDFIPMFRATKFNADEWVNLFVKAGARYVVPVAEHMTGLPCIIPRLRVGMRWLWGRCAMW